MGAVEAGLKITELGRSHPASCPIMPEFLDEISRAIGAGLALHCRRRKKCSVLNRAGCDERQEITEPAGGEDHDSVIDAKARGRYRERAAPTREDDGLGFSVMWTGVEVSRHATGIDFKMAAARAKCCAVVEHEDVRAWRGSALPVQIGRGIFLGWVRWRECLPFAEFLAECRQGIGLRGGRGIRSPEIDKGFTRVFGLLHDGQIRDGAAASARGFVRRHKMEITR
jgi:hypothetical protein